MRALAGLVSSVVALLGASRWGRPPFTRSLPCARSHNLGLVLAGPGAIWAEHRLGLGQTSQRRAESGHIWSGFDRCGPISAGFWTSFKHLPTHSACFRPRLDNIRPMSANIFQISTA